VLVSNERSMFRAAPGCSLHGATFLHPEVLVLNEHSTVGSKQLLAVAWSYSKEPIWAHWPKYKQSF